MNPTKRTSSVSLARCAGFRSAKRFYRSSVVLALGDEDCGGDPVDGQAERRPPASVGDKLLAVLPEVLAPVASETGRQQPPGSGDACRGNDDVPVAASQPLPNINGSLDEQFTYGLDRLLDGLGIDGDQPAPQ